jgi:hypothetical protein
MDKEKERRLRGEIFEADVGSLIGYSVNILAIQIRMALCGLFSLLRFHSV